MIKSYKDILLAEDNYPLAKLIKYCLEEHNYVVDISTTVEETIAKINMIKYDVLILDYSFNEGLLTGEAVMHHINKYNREIVVFANSCDDDYNNKLILLGSKGATDKNLSKILTALGCSLVP